MESLDKIEQDYKNKTEELDREFSLKNKEAKSSEEKKKLELDYKKKLKQIIDKYNSSVAKFAKGNGEALFEDDGMQEEKKEKEKKFVPFKVVPIDLRVTKKEELERDFADIELKSKIKFNNFLYAIFPRFLIRLFFRAKLFFKGMFLDIKLFFKLIFMNIKRSFMRIFSRVKKHSLDFYNMLKKIWIFLFSKIKELLPKKKKEEGEEEKSEESKESEKSGGEGESEEG